MNIPQIGEADCEKWREEWYQQWALDHENDFKEYQSSKRITQKGKKEDKNA